MIQGRGGSAWLSGKREEKGKEEEKEMRNHQEMREREAAQAREEDRGRGRGLAGLRKLGRMPSVRGNTPIVLSRPRVLVGLYQIILDFRTSSTRVLGLYP
jgi:hypothetical protein